MRLGHSSFRTKQNNDGMWKAYYEPGTSPAESMLAHDWVAWVETAWEDQVKKGVVVVNIRFDELQIELATLADPTIQGFIYEPRTPSLWQGGKDDEPVAKTTKAATGGEATPKGQRAKSDVENPTKLVWRLADEMVGSTRIEVVAACVAQGVNKATASTQYYRWQKAKQ